MLQRVRSRLADRHRCIRRLVAIWQRRDPKAWVVALLGMAMGLGAFLFMLVWVGMLRLLAHFVKALR